MSAQLDDSGALLLKQKIEDLGVTVLASKNTFKIVDGDVCKHKMVFADGTELGTDVIVYSTGIRPRDEIAAACGLDIANRGGVMIDDRCLTSDPAIYAIGECASWNDQTFGLVAPGYVMARAVVAQLAGGEGRFEGADMSTKMKLNGVDVASIGDPHGKSAGAFTYTYQNGVDGVYKRLIVSPDNKQLLGAVLVGDAAGYPTLLQYHLNGIELPEFQE